MASESPAKLHSARVAELALLVATMLWGLSFNWTKEGSAALNELCGAAPSARVGPALLMSARFFFAAIVWFAVVPASRRGWTWRSAGRGLLLGLLIGGGMLFQALGLSYTSESVSALLTSLTIFWVPLMLLAGMGKPPTWLFWIGAVLAGIGAWFVNDADHAGAGIGVLLGLGGSILFGLHMIAINALTRGESAWRLTGAQFIVVSLLSLLLVVIEQPGRQLIADHRVLAVLSDGRIWPRVAMLVALPTVLGFGLMFIYQPRVDPARAALLYLAEPVFATLFAWLLAGRAVTGRQLLGGAMILSANAFVEIVQGKRDAVRNRNAAAATPLEV